MRKTVLTIMFALVSAMVSAGDGPVRLFSELSAGMPYDEVRQLPGVQIESELDIPNVRLVRRDVDFAGGKWTQLFSFRNDRLTDIILLSDYDPERYVAVLGALQAGFSLMRVTSDQGSVDCITVLKTNPLEEVAAFIDQFEAQATKDGYIEIAYLDTAAFESVIPDYDIEQPSSQLAKLLPVETRAVTFTSLNRKLGDDPYLRVIFSTPAFTARMLQKER